MVLEDFLLPGEIITFQSGKVKTLKDHFDFYITDQRILLYRRRGVVFRKDRIIAERIEDIQTLHYYEKGITRKKGVLRLSLIHISEPTRPY